MKFLVINGANLNLLGTREPEIYGQKTLDEINNNLTDFGKGQEIELDFFQSNFEGELIEKIQTADGYDGIIINPAAHTHYSLAVADAISAVKTPVVEVHLSNIFARDRETSITAKGSIGVICGFGEESYKLGMVALKNHIEG